MDTLEQRPRVAGVRSWRPRPTLAGADDASEVVFEEERERLFLGGWVPIGRADEVPEPVDYLVRDLVGESIFVVRNRDGELQGPVRRPSPEGPPAVRFNQRWRTAMGRSTVG